MLSSLMAEELITLVELQVWTLVSVMLPMGESETGTLVTAHTYRHDQFGRSPAMDARVTELVQG